jgi:hypothetical protein
MPESKWTGLAGVRASTLGLFVIVTIPLLSV